MLDDILGRTNSIFLLVALSRSDRRVLLLCSLIVRVEYACGVKIDCSALHRASKFIFFRVRFCVDGRGAAAGVGLVEDRHDFETESTTRKMQVGKKGIERSKLREGPEPRTVCTTYI